MLKPIALAALIAVPLVGPAAAADCVGAGLIGTDYNKAIVTAFYETAVNAKDPAGAVACYVGDYYTQHNPMAPDGPEAFIAAFEGWTAAAPEIHLDIKRVIAEGDLVVTHAHLRQSPDDRGMAVMDIFRIENGKIVEHWDVVQPVPEDAANDNTMF
ncbi:nuclear transport factor 2 family protein [Pelagibacterium limicola]|uniref:nuclear transport factor 2 family protein n=1 Tax=Pelagibacterium limicola TaxID=2791022 RepID=UPI001A9C1DBE|nr:nuclear transport factor 2 family protein [Pelagibacterium limicola]